MSNLVNENLKFSGLALTPTLHLNSIIIVMSSLAPLPLTINIPTQHQRLLREIREATHRVLSLDPVRRSLVTWYWSVPALQDRPNQPESSHICRPANGKELKRVPPSDLPKFRDSHKLENPYCLCLLFAENGGGAPDEVAVLIETEGPYSGEYVAKCAKDECGYLGQFSSPLQLEENSHQVFHLPVLLERIFSRNGVPVKKYARRGKFY